MNAGRQADPDRARARLQVAALGDASLRLCASPSLAGSLEQIGGMLGTVGLSTSSDPLPAAELLQRLPGWLAVRTAPELSLVDEEWSPQLSELGYGTVVARL